MRIIEVGRHLSLFQVPIRTGELRWEGRAISVGNVGRPSCISRSLRNTWKFTWERSPTHVRIVGKPSNTFYTLINIWEITTWRPLNVRNVGKVSTSPQSLRNILGFTLERNPINVRNVGKPSVSPQSLRNILGFTLERSPINVKNVGKATLILQVLKATWRGSVDERNGEKPSFIFSRHWVQKDDVVEGSSVNEQRWKHLWTLRSYGYVRFHTCIFLKGIWESPLLSQRYNSCKNTLQDFPGSPVGKTPPFHCRGLIPGGAAKIPHAMSQGQKKIKLTLQRHHMGLRNVGKTLHTHPSLYTGDQTLERDPLISNRFEKAFISLSSFAGHKWVLSSVMSDSLRPPWTVALQAPLSMELCRQEYWNRLPFPSWGDLPNPGIEPASPAFQADSLPLSHGGSP